MDDLNNNQNNNDKFVSLININKTFDKNVRAVVDFNLDIKRYEFIVFVGPSGCGKSTTLRMIAGLEEITSGELYFDGVLVNDYTPKERDIAMVFQNYSLYPSMTVYENLAFSLKVRHYEKEEIHKRIMKAAQILDISELLYRKPKELSGGQRQRVALGRAIVRDAKVFLMDEPLSNLDAKLRVQMRSEIINLHRKIKATTIYVTHDQTEAMTMADRIVVMSKGYIQQIGTPEEIYAHPKNKFVASFIGSPAMNFIEVNYTNDNNIVFDNGFKLIISDSFAKKHNQFYKEQLNIKQLKYQKLEDELQQLQSQTFTKRKQIIKNKSDIEEISKNMKLLNEAILINRKIVNNENHRIVLGIRPENIKWSLKEKENYLSTEVILSELLGDEYYIHFNIENTKFVLKTHIKNKLLSGDKIYISFDPNDIYFFDLETELTINI